MTDAEDMSYQRKVEIRHLDQANGPRKVLVVDDNTSSRDELTEALQKKGYEVVAVQNGMEALEHMRWKWRPGCVVLDMRMPVMTGWEVRQAMLADPELRGIPVIGMTGGRWKPEDAEHFVSLMAKPIKVEELLVGLEAVWNVRISGAQEHPHLRLL